MNSFDVADNLHPLPRGTYDMACGEVSATHWEPEWEEADIQAASQENGMFTWGASDPARADAPLIKHSQGMLFLAKAIWLVHLSPEVQTNSARVTGAIPHATASAPAPAQLV